MSIVDVQAPHDLKVGYIMGAGDDIPTVLQQVGMDVTLIPAEKIATEDFGKYKLSCSAFAPTTRRKKSPRIIKKLLDFVSAGGTLVVQYNASTGEFNGGKFTPYPADLSRARVSVEEAPVEILAPNDSVFHYSQHHHAHDFDGWVQERGLYFMGTWDDHFTPLLSCHDPGEEAAEGRTAAGAIRQGDLHLYRLRILPPIAGGCAGRSPAVRKSLERGRRQPDSAVET